jgi:hypothetical protein
MKNESSKGFKFLGFKLLYQISIIYLFINLLIYFENLNISENIIIIV